MCCLQGLSVELHYYPEVTGSTTVYVLKYHFNKDCGWQNMYVLLFKSLRASNTEDLDDIDCQKTKRHDVLMELVHECGRYLAAFILWGKKLIKVSLILVVELSNYISSKHVGHLFFDGQIVFWWMFIINHKSMGILQVQVEN